MTNAWRTALAGPRGVLALPGVAGDHAPAADARAFTPANVAADAVTAHAPPQPRSAGEPAVLPEAEPDETTRRAPPTRAPAQEPAAPRVHVELHDDGLAVWLGLDAHAQASSARAADVLEQLRRHAASLPRLALLVCNGIPLHTRPRPSKETP